MTKLEAVQELSKMHHCFLSIEGVEDIVKPFGFNPKEFIHKYQDTRSQFKGLYIPDVKEGDWVEGADAMNLAISLCKRLNVEYLFQHGRGSQLETCCEALIKYLS